MAKKKTPAQITWSPQALAALANAWLAAGNAPTPEMLANQDISYTPPSETVVDPGTPAVPDAPPTLPFLTAEQMQQLNQLFHDTGDQLTALNAADTNALVAAMQQIGDPNHFDPNDKGTDLTQAVNKQAMINKVNDTDAAIARGLFQSSIRDADLADIEATRQLRRNFFRDQYNSVIKTNEASRKSIRDFLTTAVGAGYDPNDPNAKIGGNFGAMAIENAKNNPSAPGLPGVPPTIQTNVARFTPYGGAPIARGGIAQPRGTATDPDPTRHAASMEQVFALAPPAAPRRRRRR